MLHFIPRWWNATGEHLCGEAAFRLKFWQKLQQQCIVDMSVYFLLSKFDTRTPDSKLRPCVSNIESLKSWLLLVLIHFAQSANSVKAWLNFEGRLQQSRDERELRIFVPFCSRIKYLLYSLSVSLSESAGCILKSVVARIIFQGWPTLESRVFVCFLTQFYKMKCFKVGQPW